MAMHSTYHSLQTTLNRRFKDGLLLKGRTWSRAIDEAPYSDWTEFLWNAPSVFYRNRAQAVTTFPTTSSWGSSTNSVRREDVGDDGTSGAILGGWQLNGLFAAYRVGRSP